MLSTSNSRIKVGKPAQTLPLAASRQLRFLTRNLLAVLLISILLLIPCYWHSHIEGGDLGSHVYNAWLAQLVQQGKAPGVYVVWQWDNILFDLMLFYLAKAFGFAAAEKIAVSLCVLLFFWGIFALMKAVSRQSPWFLTPCIAMLSYGYVFHIGFMNYYLSLGLACVGLALLWNPSRRGLVASVLLAPVMLLAHPLGFLWFLGTAAYRLLWLRFPGSWKLLLPAVALAILLAARWFISRHAYEVEWGGIPFWKLNGADQLYLFGRRYTWVRPAIVLFFLLSTVLAWLRDSTRVSFWKNSRLILELYFVSFCATALLPENFHFDPNGGAVGILVTRLTLVTAILCLCWLASLPPRSWHLLSSSAIALVFFTFLYQDTAFLSRMEANAGHLTQQLPFGTRVLASVFTPDSYRTVYLHIPDRACIGHCFLVSNYEPSTRQFRVRVQQGSPVVASSVDDSEDMQSGNYEVQEEDLPLKQIYQCDASDLTRICIRDLAEGEKNGRLGYHPRSDSPSSQKP